MADAVEKLAYGIGVGREPKVLLVGSGVLRLDIYGSAAEVSTSLCFAGDGDIGAQTRACWVAGSSPAMTS